VQSLNNLAGLYNKHGRYDEAEPLYKRVVTIDEMALGPNDPNVASALTNLVSLYRNQGRYAEAVPLLKRVLAIVEKVLGPNRPGVALVLTSLADLYSEQGHDNEAEPALKTFADNPRNCARIRSSGSRGCAELFGFALLQGGPL
jgi:tetratricopeptide (TPR) repeat protein